MTARIWLLGDLSCAGTVRFARVDRARPHLEEQRTFASEQYPTFSDALLSYARAADVDLRTAGCVLSLPGPTAGNTIRVARSRWTLSRSGLGGMFGGSLFLLNDMAATAWSLTEPDCAIEALGTSVRPDLTQPGRWAMVLLDDGVGAAILTIDVDGRVAVGESEVGHVGFAPATAREMALVESLRGCRPALSWEHVLTADRHGDGKPIDLDEWAGLAGAFAGDIMLSAAAWSGVILCGRRSVALRTREAQAAFVSRAIAKASHGRFIEQGLRALLPARDPLEGCLAFLKARTPPPGATKAAWHLPLAATAG